MIAWALFMSLAGAGEPVPWTSIGEVTHEGFAADTEVASYIRRHGTEVSYCLAAALREDPSVSGTLKITLTVEPLVRSDDVWGKVVAVSAVPSGAVSEMLQRCVERKNRRWLLPEPASATAVVRYVVQFEALELPVSSTNGLGLVVDPHGSLPHSMVLNTLRPTWSEAWLAHEKGVRSGSKPLPGPLVGQVRLIGREATSGARHLELGGVTWTSPPDGKLLEAVSAAFGDPTLVAPDPASEFSVQVRLTLQEPE